MLGWTNAGSASNGGGGSMLDRIPEFTGQFELIGDEKNGRMRLLSSGVFTPRSDMVVDLFLVGGGGAGSAGSNPSSNTYICGGGGGGGFITRALGIVLFRDINYAVEIGAGGLGTRAGSNVTDGGATSFAAYAAEGGKHGGNGNSKHLGGAGESGGGAGVYCAGSNERVSGIGGSDGSDALTGLCGGSAPVVEAQGIGTGISTLIFGQKYSPGGGGGGRNKSYIPESPGGDYGGGRGGLIYVFDAMSGLPNTGAGGGGAGTSVNSYTASGDGGSGVVIVAWGNGGVTA